MSSVRTAAQWVSERADIHRAGDPLLAENRSRLDSVNRSGGDTRHSRLGERFPNDPLLLDGVSTRIPL